MKAAGNLAKVRQEKKVLILADSKAERLVGHGKQDQGTCERWSI